MSANNSLRRAVQVAPGFPAFMRARLIGGVDVDVSPGEREEIA